jgi:hypothetical protein
MYLVNMQTMLESAMVNVHIVIAVAICGYALKEEFGAIMLVLAVACQVRVTRKFTVQVQLILPHLPQCW